MKKLTDYSKTISLIRKELKDYIQKYNLKSLVSDFRAIGVQLQTFSTDPDTQTAAVADQKIDNGQQATSTELSGEPNVGVHFTLNLVIRKSLFNE